MATYVVQAPAHSGGTITMSAPGGASGDLAPTGSGLGLLVQSGTAPGSVSLALTPQYDGLAIATRVISWPLSGLLLIPLPPAVYGVGTTAVAYSNVTGVTVAVIQVAT